MEWSEVENAKPKENRTVDRTETESSYREREYCQKRKEKIHYTTLLY